MLAGLRRVLRRQDLDIHTATSPSHALSLLKELDDVAVVVSDFQMPEMNGAQFLQLVATEAPAATRLLLTGRSESAVAIEAINVGQVFRFLSKPVAPEELIAAVSAAVEEHRVRGGTRAEVEASTRSQHRRAPIERAIGGAIRTVFQPIVDAGDGGVVGHEALSRFPDPPERPPDAWFAEADALGLGSELDAAAARSALRTWREVAPPQQSLWVNLSPATIMAGTLTDVLSAAAPGLVVEITERVPVADYPALTAALEPLRGSRVELAIDDVGAGFASLRHISELRPDIVKLDRSLIVDLDADEHRQALVASLIDFAARRRMTVLTEGVETREQAALLRDMGAQLAQGWLFGRPQPTPLVGRDTPDGAPQAPGDTAAGRSSVNVAP